MRSLKTYFILSTLVFSVTVVAADRSRDRGAHDRTHSNKQSYLQKRVAPNKHNNARDGGYLERQIAKSNHNKPRAKGAHDSRRAVNQGKHVNKNYTGPRNNHYSNNQRGFNGDYRNNPHFDNRNYHYNDYRNHNRQHITHNYYKPKKHYKKWKKQLKHYRKHLRNQYRHLHNYNYYSSDLYRYRPLRGLGHYFVRPGYGYGHWHEGYWCMDYHDEYFYRDYYTYYPYQDGWRNGDGDFGIWFSFNL